jgi:hypothetical protein
MCKNIELVTALQECNHSRRNERYSRMDSDYTAESKDTDSKWRMF